MTKINRDYIKFTKQMKRDYTILIPNMLPIHFNMVIRVMESYGYKAKMLNNEGHCVVENGLKYVHNDTCYPAILVIGQFIDALKSGEYDTRKVALMLFQTGGGCRASNYVSLLRKALIKAGFGYVPVVSFSLTGIEKHPGFKLTIPFLHKLMYAVTCGDLLMSLYNQCRTTEINRGQSRALLDRWTERVAHKMRTAGPLRYSKIKECYREIVKDFAQLPRRDEKPVRVGIVGEICVKFSSLGNNGLEQFLVDEGAQVCVPGFLDFCFYCIYNSIMDKKLYNRIRLPLFIYKFAFNFAKKKQRDMIDAVVQNSSFEPMTPIEHTISLCQGYINLGVKMGEGWLLTAEMLELYDSGTKNIICTQPFGCLPNHICGKGMMRPLKEQKPDINIVAVDYDAGATKVNQINRIKLMLANAKEQLNGQEKNRTVQSEKSADKEAVLI